MNELFDVSWSGHHCLPLLEFIKDFVIVKKEQVLLGIELAKLVPVGKGKRGKFEDNQKRLSIGVQITKLNDAAPRGVIKEGVN